MENDFLIVGTLEKLAAEMIRNIEHRRIFEKIKSWKSEEQRAYLDGYSEGMMYAHKLLQQRLKAKGL